MNTRRTRAQADAFLKGFTGLAKSLALYPSGHKAVERAQASLEKALAVVFAGPEPLLVGCADGYLVVGGHPYLDPTSQARTVSGWFERRGVEGVLFARGVEPGELSRFCGWLRSDSPEPWPPGGAISVTRLERDGSVWERGVGTYHSAVDALEEVHREIQAGRIPSPERARESVEAFLELVGESPAVARGLTLLKDYDRYTFHHSVNVCIHSLGLGKHLGLSVSDLVCLGLGGLFHDIGKTRTPPELVRKPAKLSTSEWAIMWRHPEQGRDILREMGGVPPLMPRVVHEHHMGYDGGGYPARPRGHALSSLSPFVTVADVFDAMTSHRSYSAPLPLPEAVRLIVGRRGAHFAPEAIDAFLAVVGPTPVGSVVRLATGEVAVVCRVERGEISRVEIVLDPDGSRRPADASGSTETTSTEIVGWVDPLAHGIDPAEIFRRAGQRESPKGHG